MLCVEDVASVARDLACVFSLLRMCSRLKDLNPDCKCLTWLKYPCILSSLAPSSPFTWLTTSLEFENTFTAFPLILWTMDIPSSKVSYSALLFVVEKASLSDFLMVICSGETRTSPTLEPLWFATLFTYTFHNKGSCREIVSTDFSSMFCVSTISFNRGLANLATRSVRTWPLIKVWGKYLMSKAPRTVPHFAILLV